MSSRVNEDNVILGEQLRAGHKVAMKKILAAVRRNGGDVKAAASELGIPRRTIYKWIMDVPLLRKSIAEIRYVTNRHG